VFCRCSKLFENKDTKQAILICKELVKQGMDFKYFIEELMGKLHLMLLQKVGVEKSDKQTTLELTEIRKLFQLLTAAYLETKSAVLAQMPLEMVVIEWAGEGNVVDGGQSHAVQDAHDDRGPVGSLPPASAHSRLTDLRAVGSPSSAATPQTTTPRANESSENFVSPRAKNNVLADLINEVKNTKSFGCRTFKKLQRGRNQR